MKKKLRTITKMIDHSLLHPTMTDDVLRVRALGVTRVGATATETFLEEAKAMGYV